MTGIYEARVIGVRPKPDAPGVVIARVEVGRIGLCDLEADALMGLRRGDVREIEVTAEFGRLVRHEEMVGAGEP